mgnify:FL=1
MGLRAWLVALAMEKPKQVFFGVIALVVLAGLQIPSIKVDTDPENMLPHDQVDRVFHDEVKKRFSLYDSIIVGVVNTQNPQGVYNPQTLQDLHKLSSAVQSMPGVIRQDLMSLDTVDNISQSSNQPGAIRFEWMMKSAPTTQAQADKIKASVENLPLLQNTLVSGDGKAAGIYIPIESKSESYRLSKEIQTVIDQLKAESPAAENEFYMAGLPVAEDTFGVEMFIQMAISAPLAGLMIFILMWVFFRSMLLITAPMLVAMAAVIITMGLLIGQGYTVHIMSSMIPIFLMPIAVVDSVHILSEFSDRYKPGDKPNAALKAVVGHLFTPMFYTSITSAVGFASLAFTPIPPVQIFGLHVAFGILLAFVLTVTLVPAYIVSLSPARLAALKDHSLSEQVHEENTRLLSRLLAMTGRFSIAKSKTLVMMFVVVSLVSIYGLTTIQINDNPVRWFKEDHRLRIADRVMNEHFSGTYDAFLVLERTGLDAQKTEFLAYLRKQVNARDNAQAVTDKLESILRALEGEDYSTLLQKLTYQLDDAAYEDSANEAHWMALLDTVEQAQSSSKYFLTPSALRYLNDLQLFLDDSALVGKSNSLVTLLKTVYRELQGGDPAHYKLPDNSNAAAQTILSFQSSHRPDDLWHMVTPDFNATALWLQLKSGDNQEMSRVIKLVDDYVSEHPLPANVEMNWAGLTYINVVWQEQMVTGMLSSLASAFFMVLVMMFVLFRSIKLGLLAMLPLTVTILFIYGLIGFVGKDYDMPIAVLSALTLGLSVDFAIHFLERCRTTYQESGSWPSTVTEMYKGPARAISRNAVVVAIGFTPLLFAPLVPYITVGFFLAMIMAVSAVVTVVLLPAVINGIKDKDKLFAMSEDDRLKSIQEKNNV